MITVSPPRLRSDSPPWQCSFDATPVSVLEGGRLRLDLDGTVERGGGSGGRHQYAYALAYRGVGATTPTRAAEREFDALDMIYFSRPFSASHLSDPLSAGDYEVGVCFDDRRADQVYEVQASVIVTTLPPG